MLALVLASPMAAGGQTTQPQPSRGESTHGQGAGITLRQRIIEQLRAGRTDEALRTAQRSLAEHPGDSAAREEVISFCLSLARQKMTEENFSVAERALLAVLQIDENHPEAQRLTKAIRTSRRQTPRRVDEARRWITMEWFEPAFNTLRQAGALLPDRRREWARAYRSAAIGAGDDHYFTKTFHRAFYFYDAAMRLGDESAVKPSPSLASCWLQCMVHALAADVEHTVYPPDYWELTLRRAQSIKVPQEAGQELHAMLRGLSWENLGETRRALREYGRVVGRTPPRSGHRDIREHRAEALRTIRSQYDVRLSERRKGLWADHAAGDWQVLKTPRFLIHHRNDRVARRVADALNFHFERIARLMVLDPEEVSWPINADVYLHADGNALRRVIDQPEQVRAFSVIRHRGRNLQAHTIHAHQDDPLLLSASLSHELAHLMVGAVTEYHPFAAAMNEGIALQVEPACRHRQFDRLFGRLKTPRSITQLLKVDAVHPPDADFYAEAQRLSAVLSAYGDLGMMIQAGRAGMNERHLAKLFGFRSVKAMGSAYRSRAQE